MDDPDQSFKRRVCWESLGGFHPIYMSSLFVTRTHTLFSPLVLPSYFALILPSGAGEIAPTSSKAVVFPKFDMHVYTSELTSSELEAAVADYLIPLDLHPHLPPLGMTMDKLPSWVHVSQLVPMGVNRDHWFSFENKTGRGTRKCFKDVTTSLKDLHGDFPSNFNQDDIERLSEFFVLLRPPPHHLLYVCGLTMACRHPRLSYSIKDQDKNLISVDTFLKLPTWTGTIVSKGDPIPEDQHLKPRVTPPLPEGSKIPDLTAFQRNVEMPNTKIVVAREKKERQSLARAEAKRASVGHAGGGPHVEKEVVDLSGNTRVSTPPATANEPSPPLGHHNADENPDPDTQSHQSSQQGHELVGNRYVPNWELRNDLRVCTYRACRELVNHVATPAEDKFLGTLSNAELNHDYVDIRNCHDTDLAELECLRSVLSKANQNKDEITKKFTLLDNAHSECTSRERELLDMVKELEREWDEWRATASDQADRKKLVKEFIPIVVKRLHTSVEYRKSLAALVQLCFTVGCLGGLALGRTEEEVARFLSETQDLDTEGSKSWEERHRALFSTLYPYVQKIVDSCDLPLSELWSVHPDAPSPEGVTLGGAAESTVQQPPSTSSKTTSDIPFGTTT
uniref:Transposase (Putative), gypsy type n=1 Tax=Tanacetum cinerariifolium TaxID=118510 RepID=A0A6L2LCD8_TANCI|nr:hypothetical protein [Tanacetum cinerariifolium]